jgi:hypothetical protein
MTITYPNGTALEVILLSHQEHQIRAAARGCDDVLIFSRIHGVWISEDLDPGRSNLPGNVAGLPTFLPRMIVFVPTDWRPA